MQLGDTWYLDEVFININGEKINILKGSDKERILECSMDSRLLRRILDRKGIEIGKKDPIDVFTDTFGESISDVNNLAEEMIEIDARGGGMKDMDQMLEADGLFDIEIPTNPQKGLTDDELLELIKKTDEEKILTDFDPTGRKPNATGGRVQAASGGLADILKV